MKAIPMKILIIIIRIHKNIIGKVNGKIIKKVVRRAK